MTRGKNQLRFKTVGDSRILPPGEPYRAIRGYHIWVDPSAGDEDTVPPDPYYDQHLEFLCHHPGFEEAIRTQRQGDLGHIKRQTLDAFDVQIAYDKAEGRIEVSATVSEAIADALETTKPSERRA